MEAERLSGLHQKVTRMGEDTVSYVIVEIKKNGKCDWIWQGDNLHMTYMAASLMAFVYTLLTPSIGVIPPPTFSVVKPETPT